MFMELFFMPKQTEWTNNLSTWLNIQNEQSDFKGQHDFVLFYFCLYDPATSVAPNSVLGTSFPSESSLFVQFVLLPHSFCEILFEFLLQKLHSAPLRCDVYEAFIWGFLHCFPFPSSTLGNACSAKNLTPHLPQLQASCVTKFFFCALQWFHPHNFLWTLGKLHRLLCKRRDWNKARGFH